jgi:hypothetical protein
VLTACSSTTPAGVNQQQLSRVGPGAARHPQGRPPLTTFQAGTGESLPDALDSLSGERRLRRYLDIASGVVRIGGADDRGMDTRLRQRETKRHFRPARHLRSQAKILETKSHRLKALMIGLGVFSIRAPLSFQRLPRGIADGPLGDHAGIMCPCQRGPGDG